MKTSFNTVGVVGAGAMGRGIAQVLAQAGCRVLLFDAQPQAVASAQQNVNDRWDQLAQKGRLDAETVQAFKARLVPAHRLDDLAGCDLVIEAIVERLDAKQALFAQLEGLVSPSAVLATNTSSLSVAAIGAGLREPRRLAGLHFFNPVPLMKVVEVIAGQRTDPAVCQRLSDLVRAFGHTPVQAQDTPGFIVNHAGRGYTTEALRIVSEGVADFATIDRILCDQVGFKLGPFELLDLTGLDVSHPAMETIYHQFYEAFARPPSQPSAWPLACSGARPARASTATRTASRSARPSRRPRRWPRSRRSGCPPARPAAPSCTSCSRNWARPGSKPASRPRPMRSRWWRHWALT